MDIKVFEFNPFMEHCYIADSGNGNCVIIDPGCRDKNERERLTDYLHKEGLKPEAVLLTHAHFDHIYGVKWLQDTFNIPVYLHNDDSIHINDYCESALRYGLDVPDTGFSSTAVHDGDTLKLAGMEFSVIETPGHTPGCVCYYEKNNAVMFTGDTLFAGSIGRTDLPHGDYDSLIKSVMEKLIVLDAETDILPGHGASSNIGRERTSNPFLEPFNEPDQDYNV